MDIPKHHEKRKFLCKYELTKVRLPLFKIFIEEMEWKKFDTSKISFKKSA